MGAYLLRRALQALGVLLGVSVLVFAIIHLVPGDPVRLALGTRFDQETYDALRSRAGLDQPLLQQYVSWLGGVVQGDFGVSFRSGQTVLSMVTERLPATLSLAGAAVVVALLIALPLGVLSAIRQGSRTDTIATAISQFGISVPDFWMGILLILLFSLTLGWLPASGYVGLSEDPLEWARRLILPGVTVGVVSGAVLTRFVRSSVLESLGEDFVRTAQSKGLSERRIIREHVLPNALVPVITVTGLQLAYLLSGVVVVEAVFAWPGLGQLALDAVQDRDYPVLQGAVMLFAGFFLLVNLLVDLLYAVVDPRIQY
ncbi:Dipeptide transport system permease protein DppB [Euzebya pacifica]|uniref:Dipeptide transport system permease protein DppB n=1 Tax=Euzebya pacifica TaxID=1608957 RepID=A0A346XWK1_9ACTN|nr:ABC transporter permease [Euzebya pacifica]AXV06598.1 Dipeptide transport system permease protein DppB [Euzebya pacifica]